MPFENKSHPLLPTTQFVLRQVRFSLYTAGLIAFSLGVGVLGYHCFDKLGWVDSLLNSSMILAGMGPVDATITNSAKLFASFYALFSGITFLTTVAVFLAPIVHRFLHILHLDNDNE